MARSSSSVEYKRLRGEAVTSNLTSNPALERTAGSHSLAAAAHRDR